MLAALSIRDIVIIDKLDIAFERGLSALTGETGAGKSILLDSLSLAIGGRGDAALVRRGAERGQVTAVFDVGGEHPARALLAEHGFETDGDIMLRRVQSADGRTRAFVNDQPASVQLLSRLGGCLVEIHGQHDDRALIDPVGHRHLLDSWGELGAAVSATGSAWNALREAEAELAEAREALATSASEREYLVHSLDELEALDPEAGEEAQLAERRKIMMHAEKISEELTEAGEAVGGGGSPVPLLASALRRLERRAADLPDLLDPVVASLTAALNALEESRTTLDRARDETSFDPRDLEAAEERLFALRAAARKHQVGVDDLPAVRDRMRAALARIETGGERVAALEATVNEARRSYDAAARRLSAQRRRAGQSLDQAVMAELAPLKLERARFETRIETEQDHDGPHGRDRVEFWVQTNPGTRPGPLLKVASGGELSRFLLALKVALADKGSAPTLVFDEIDTAVGGAVSDAIGVRLQRLSGRVQVLTVTHAPQVAARADRHLLIRKDGNSGRPDGVVTRVEALDPASRREEIARMLAGATVTDEARAAAGRLLAGAT